MFQEEQTKEQVLGTVAYTKISVDEPAAFGDGKDFSQTLCLSPQTGVAAALSETRVSHMAIVSSRGQTSGSTMSCLLLEQLLKNLLQVHYLCVSWSRNCDSHCFIKAVKHCYHHQRQRVIPFIWGILVGVTLTAVLFQQHVIYNGAIPWPTDGAKALIIRGFEANLSGLDKQFTDTIINGISEGSIRDIYGHSSDVSGNKKNSFSSTEVEKQVRVKTRIYVGVITAEKFLGTRSVAVNNTWGSQVDKVEFFTEKGSISKYHVPVVNLEGVSDSEYPPQKKAFRMLQHMCKHHITNYEWFIRADDDVYIRVEKLRHFLTQVDGDKMIYMGQPGHGVPEVRDKLGLNGHNFCMGGPGVLFNQRALKELCPHIDQCMAEVMSGEEDVEIGRCVTKHLHIECTHAWETLKLFYHSYQEEYSEEKPFLGNLAENDHVGRALTLHHIKVPYIMYRVHRHYTSLLLNSTVQGMSSLQKKLDQTNIVLPFGQRRSSAVTRTIPPELKPLSMKESNSWRSFEIDSIYSLAPSNTAKDITNDVLADLKQVGETGIDESIGHAEQHKYTYSHVRDGYLRSNPLRGTDYLLDIYFNNKQRGLHGQTRRVHLLRPLGEVEVTSVRESSVLSSASSDCFYIVVPVPSKAGGQLESFMKNYYEPTFLSRPGLVSATLVVVPVGELNGEEAPSSPSIEDVVNWYKIKYRDLRLDLLSAEADDADESSEWRMQRSFARGVLRAEQLHKSSPGCSKANALLLLTLTNFSLSFDAYKSCALRGGKLSQNSFDRYDAYNFMQYRSGRPVARLQSQLYQPVPFQVFPAAYGALWPVSNVGNRIDGSKSNAPFASNSLSSELGFWGVSIAALESGDGATAPLCGQLVDFLSSARESVSPSNLTHPVIFRDLLLTRIYSGELRMLSAPDKAFLELPAR